VAGAVAETVVGPVVNPAEWLTIPDAARVAGVLERTVRRWVSSGAVASTTDADGRRVQRESLPVVATDSASGSESGASGRDSGPVSVPASDLDSGSDESVPLIPPRHEAECACCKVWERQVGTLEEQLAHRAEELRRRDQAEAELRRLLLVAQQSLQAAMERPALPPASAHNDVQRRVRWWNWWRR
jgi:hypothetical protein